MKLADKILNDTNIEEAKDNLGAVADIFKAMSKGKFKGNWSDLIDSLEATFDSMDLSDKDQEKLAKSIMDIKKLVS